MGRPKSNGQYAKLSATYYFDDAILEAGEKAEVLWTRCLAFLSTSSSDGFITDMQMKAAIGMNLRSVPKRVDDLLRVGLLEQVDGGFIARSWLKWNKSAAEIGRERKRDRERKARYDADVPPDSDWNPDGIHPDSSPQYKDSAVQDKDSDVVPLARPDVTQLCELLADLIESNGSKRPTITKGWQDAARLLIDKDSRDIEAAARLIRWSQQDSFWKSNILSMPKFREKYDQLRLNANQEREKRQQPSAAQRAASLVGTFSDSWMEPTSDAPSLTARGMELES